MILIANIILIKQNNNMVYKNIFISIYILIMYMYCIVCYYLYHKYKIL